VAQGASPEDDAAELSQPRKRARVAPSNNSYVRQPHSGPRVECDTVQERVRLYRNNERRKKKRADEKITKANNDKQ